jgi:arylsulfatase A-like enzyme
VKRVAFFAADVFTLLSLVVVFMAAGCDVSTHRIVRLKNSNAHKVEVRREVRRVLPVGAAVVLDLREYHGCELHLGAAPRGLESEPFIASLRSVDDSVLRTLSFIPDIETVPGASDESSSPDLAETALDPEAERGWIDQRVVLDDESVASVELAAPPPGGVWGEPLFSCPAEMPGRRWNVIMVSLDTLRADRLGVYGSSKQLTPALDRFAHRSIVFENAFTTFPNTLAAHASLFTGYHPSQHQLMVDSGARLPDEAATLAAHFSDSGYATVAFTENAYVSSDLGFHVGFDRYHNGPVGRDGELFPGVASQTFARGIDWLKNRPSAPFFLFLHTYEVHTPYTPTWRARQLRLRADKTSYEGEFDTWFGGIGEIIFNRRLREFTTGELAQIERLYDGEVMVLDEVVENFLTELRLLGLLRDTVVVFFADHGEEFNEHGYLGHGETLHDQAIRIPLIIRAPVSVARSGRISEPVSIIDVARTVADLAGVPPFARSSPGRNLADWVRADRSPTVTAAFSELNKTDASCRDHLQGDLAHCAFGGMSVRDGSYVYIRSSVFDWERLYDAKLDPLETHDISQEHPELLARYRRVLDEHVEAMVASLQPISKARLEKATADKLKALGYTE